MMNWSGIAVPFGLTALYIWLAAQYPELEFGFTILAFFHFSVGTVFLFCQLWNEAYDKHQRLFRANQKTKDQDHG